jgi:transposase
MPKLHANARTCPHCRSLIVRSVTEDHQTHCEVARAFRVSERTVRKWVDRFSVAGASGLTDRTCRPHHIPRRYLQPSKELHDAVFSLLHTPPSQHGFNRTTWTLLDLYNTLRAQGARTTKRNLSAVIRRAGYRWKQARITLTSTDPDYRNRLDGIRLVLSRLQEDEAFFSIDEFGPFAVKMRGGRSLCPRVTSGPYPSGRSRKEA